MSEESRELEQEGEPAATPERGLFITFEGIEGCGKTTQIEKLRSYLVGQGCPVVVTREPGGTVIGAEIRRILLNPYFKEMDWHTEVLLYAADRAQHVAEVIKPALEAGKIVISDRFVDSSIAYQHYGRGLPLDLVLDVNERAVQGLKPDITFLLDLPVEEGLRRATRERTDRIEAETIEFHERVEAGFKELVIKELGRWKVIDAAKPVDEVHRAIVEAYCDIIAGCEY